MNKKVLLFLCIMVFAISCSDETTHISDPKSQVELEDDQQVLEEGILYDKAGVLGILEQDKSTGKFTRKAPEDEMAGDHPLTLVAQVDPPSFKGGSNLTASHVHVDGDFAYVAYNTVSSAYVGAIDVIDVSNPNKPKITSRLYYLNADVNSVKYENGYVYAVGGVDAELSVRATTNSFVVKIPCSNGVLETSAEFLYGFQEGYVSTDVETMDNKIIVTSGKQGSLGVYDRNNVTLEKEISFTDLRSVTVSDSNIAVLDGSKGVSLYDQNFQMVRDIMIDTDFGESSKKTLEFFGDKLLVSEGAKGAGVYNYSSGSLLDYIPIPINPEGVEELDIVTNAVAANEDIVLMANGGAGLSLSEEKNNEIDVFGIIDLDGSINYVESKGDYVFAASGKEGLQIIKLNRPSTSVEINCANLPAYSGSANLNVNSNDVLAYRGSKRFNNINVNGSLTLCGSWTVKTSANVNSDALFEMNGSFVFGTNNKRKNLTVNNGATFRVEGSIIIYGDLILNDGASMEFVGSNSSIEVFGEVKKAETATVSGNFNDVRGKF